MWGRRVSNPPQESFLPHIESGRSVVMFILIERIIVFLIAISVIRSVIGHISRLWSGTSQPRPVFRPQPPSSATGNTSTLLQQDPICGTYVGVDTSLKKIIAGRVYHFCSAECRSRFTA